jgi:hypothetical protein
MADDIIDQAEEGIAALDTWMTDAVEAIEAMHAETRFRWNALLHRATCTAFFCPYCDTRSSRG